MSTPPIGSGVIPEEHLYINGTESIVYAFTDTDPIHLSSAPGRVPVLLKSIYGMSIATSTDQKPVMALGKKYIAGFTQGSRFIAGKIMFFSSIKAPFFELQESMITNGLYPYYTSNYGDNIYSYIAPDVMPPINLIVLSDPANKERGIDVTRFYTIQGLKITASQEQIEVGNIAITVYDYTAKAFKQLYTPSGDTIEVPWQKIFTRLNSLSNNIYQNAADWLLNLEKDTE